MGRMVFCDIEGTLIDGNSTRGFVREGRRMRMFAPRRMALAQGYLLLMRMLPGPYATQLRWRAILQLLAGNSRAQVEEAGRAGMDLVRAQLKPQMVARLAEHKRAGDTVVLLSGGLHDAAKVIAEEVGADRGEGTRPELRDGRYTGRMGGAPINHGPAKAARARALAAERGVFLADCVAYGDSAADIPLLASVGRPIAVDPDPRLRAAAQAHGWEILTTTPS
jgi:HAD superfamily hydrolase (TIGR01490 family)